MMVADSGPSSGQSSHVDEESMEPMRIAHAYDKDAPQCFESMIDKKWAKLLLLLCIVAAFMALIPTHRAGPEIVQLQCPGSIGKLDNDEAGHLVKDYLTESGGKGNIVLSENFTHFLKNFKETDYDNWGYTYEQVKKGMYHWKSTMYPDNVNEGDLIYESACGIGLNLYMTMEIINEIKGLESLVLYGNEYLDPSTVKANAFLDYAAPFSSKKGTICTADSTHLDYVPSNMFDLVFTGYITPIYDPIKVGNATTVKQNYRHYRDFCEGTDYKSQKLKQLAQEKQEAFYATWVGEMIRIAKPGKAVIVEQVSMPYCDEYRDWGGVAKEWWRPAIEQYGWEIDPESIVMEKDEIFTNRYHVFMRKNNMT